MESCSGTLVNFQGLSQRVHKQQSFDLSVQWTVSSCVQLAPSSKHTMLQLYTCSVYSDQIDKIRKMPTWCPWGH